MAKKYAPKNNPGNPNILAILLVMALAALAVAMLFRPSSVVDAPQEITLSEMLHLYQDDVLESVEIKGQKISAQDREGQKFFTTKEITATIKDLGLNDLTKNTSVEIADTTKNKVWLNLLAGVAPFLLIILFLFFITRKASGMGGESGPFGFGKSRAKLYDKEKHTTKFADVAGAEEAKEEVFEIVDFLKKSI